MAENGDSHFSPDGGSSGRPARESGCPLRIVVGVDPPALGGRDLRDRRLRGRRGGIGPWSSLGTGYVLADASVGGLSPEAGRGGSRRRRRPGARTGWSPRPIMAAAMVEAVLRGAGIAACRSGWSTPPRARWRGRRRSRPCSRPAGPGSPAVSRTLEDELCGLTWDGRYHGPGASPDRADAMVWALTELMLGPRRDAPRIRML